jgi:hypothetical protein
VDATLRASVAGARSQKQDPKKMIALTAEIIRLLNEKEDRLFHPVAKAEGNTMTQP